MSLKINRPDGFTLLEVLVALAVLSLSFGLLLQILGTSSRSAALAADYRYALMVAESQLAIYAADVSHDAGAPEGTLDDKFFWSTRFESFDDDTAPRFPLPFTPVLITVEVTWNDAGRDRKIELATVRLQKDEDRFRR